MSTATTSNERDTAPRLRGAVIAVRRWGPDLWAIAQATLAAATAWFLATRAVHHHEPFFAPISAVIALNATRGERGANVMRLLLGVFVGIGIGEITLVLLGPGYGRLALATFVAMTLARALHGARIVIAQAAGSAILTVTISDGAQAGIDRMIDAVIGGGVALIITQLVFAPEPVHLVRRVEVERIAAMAEGLELAARALERDDDELGNAALDKLRDVRDGLAELHRVTRASSRVTRHSIFWRSRARADAVARENERAHRFDQLGSSCLLLARTILAASSIERRALAPHVRDLATAIAELAHAPTERDVGQHAADRMLELARRIAHDVAAPGSTLAAANMMVQLVAFDLLTFLGIDAAAALEAIGRDTGGLHVPTPPPMPRLVFAPRDR
jgi:uncharacterized membrane protein YgaE (UPF0421/DUF939 family)